MQDGTLSPPEQQAPPFVGALLRLCWQQVRSRLYDAIRQHGFDDIQEAHFAVFSYPMPDGARPSDLARQLGMSRQAVNYILGQLEAAGYLERRAALGAERRQIRFTARGWAVAEVMWATLRHIQKDWAHEVGEAQFTTFMSVLRQLAQAGPPFKRE